MKGDDENREQVEPDITDVDLFEALISYANVSRSSKSSEPEGSINGGRQPFDVYVIVEGEEPFNGACFDTGAQRSVVGRKQADAYYRYIGIPLIIKQIHLECTIRYGTERKYRKRPSFAFRTPVRPA